MKTDADRYHVWWKGSRSVPVVAQKRSFQAQRPIRVSVRFMASWVLETSAHADGGTKLDTASLSINQVKLRVPKSPLR
jgi:hypothetical protein